MGSEPTPAAFVAALVDLFRDLRTALRDDGTLWLNLGDSYAGGGGYYPDAPSNQNGSISSKGAGNGGARTQGKRVPDGLKPKDLIGIPWRVALALQSDGWYLRSDIIWHKLNPMPESVTDRPTRSHEHIFLLSKRPTYYYDADAVKEEVTGGTHPKGTKKSPPKSLQHDDSRAKIRNNASYMAATWDTVESRNKRDVWTVPSAAFPGSHFATFPPDLIRPCILAGTSERGACAACGAPWRRVVERTPMVIARSDRGAQLGEYGRTAASGTMLEPATSTTTGWAPSCTCGTTETRPCLVADPFMGSGTTAMVCVEEGRDWLGCDLDDRARGWLAERLAALPVARIAGC